MPEKNLLAAFSTWAAAQDCQRALFEAGWDIVEVAPVNPLVNPQHLARAPLVEWGRLGFQPWRLDDKWTSSANWTDSYADQIRGATWLLTAVVPADDADRAADVIQQYGGSL